MLIYGEVQFHSELISLYLSNISKVDKSKISGGGRYCVYDKTNTVFFYGESQSYGKCTKLEFESAFALCKIDESWFGKTIVFSTKEYLSDVLKEHE